jgi:hypothetical protein
MSTRRKQLSLRDRCEKLSAEFSPLLAARVRAAGVDRIMNQRTSWKFRLNQLVSYDSRLGKIWEH